jgi:type IV fimbrial biogenesis protein FimT
MAVGISQYTKYKADRELMRQANMLMDEINWIKSQSISKEPHGIVITVSNYTLFKDLDGDCNYSTGDEIVRAINFIDGITSSTTQTIVFDRKGYPRNANCGLGQMSITLSNNLGHKKLICISRYGRIKIEADTCTNE